VCGSCDDQDNNERGKHPVDKKFYEWKLKDIESNVQIKLWVFHSKVLTVSKKNPILPSAGSAHPEEKRE
jgi:hypothetical protein